MTDTPQWKSHMGAYDDDELRMVRFKDREEAHRAILVIEREEPATKDAPYDFANGRTFCVPIEVIPYLEKHGLEFTTSTLLDPDTLSPEARERFEVQRRRHVM